MPRISEDAIEDDFHHPSSTIKEHFEC